MMQLKLDTSELTPLRTYLVCSNSSLVLLSYYYYELQQRQRLLRLS